MVHIIGLKEGVKFRELPEKLQNLMDRIFEDHEPADYEEWFKFGAIEAAKSYYLYVPFLDKIVSFPKQYFKTYSVNNNNNLESRYNGSYYKTKEGIQFLKKIQQMHQKNTQIEEVTSTGSVGGSYETAFPATKKDMEELEALKRNPSNMYKEDQEIIQEIKIKAFKQLMAEKYIYGSAAAKASNKNSNASPEKKSMPKQTKNVPKAKNDLVDSKTRRLTDDEKIEAHKNGLTDLKYDNISEKAKENNEANLKAGDGGKSGNWAGENYSDPNLGKKMIDAAKKRANAKREKDATMAGVSVGDDFESVPHAGAISKSHGFKENKTINKNVVSENKKISDKKHRNKQGFYHYDKDGNYLSYSKYPKAADTLAKSGKIATTTIEVKADGKERKFDNTNILKDKGMTETIKKYTFKHRIFETVDEASKFIPSPAKSADNIFIMEDKLGNNIKFKWTGLESGVCEVLEENFPEKQTLFENGVDKFATYDSEEAFGKSSINEDENFFSMLTMLKESTLDNEKKIFDLNKIFKQYHHTKLTRDVNQNLVLTVNGSYDLADETVGFVLKIKYAGNDLYDVEVTEEDSFNELTGVTKDYIIKKYLQP